MQYELFAKARVATKTLPSSLPDVTGSHQYQPVPGGLLPGQHGNMAQHGWQGNYLDVQQGFDLGSNEQGQANAELDFFEPVAAM